MSKKTKRVWITREADYAQEYVLSKEPIELCSKDGVPGLDGHGRDSGCIHPKSDQFFLEFLADRTVCNLLPGGHLSPGEQVQIEIREVEL